MSRLPIVHRPFVAFFFLAVGSAVGCDRPGPGRYPISGTVTYKGEPIKYGNIAFRSDDGATSGADIYNGRYEIPASGGLPEGTYRVAVTCPDPKDLARRSVEASGPFPPVGELLPPKYNAQTELTARIKAGAHNDVSFDLK